MRTGKGWRWLLVGIVMMAASAATNSHAADGAKDPALSKALTEVKLFAGLTDAEKDAVASVAKLRRGQAGERIIEQGKRMDMMFIVMKGEAEVRINGKHLVTHSGQPLVGELEFLDGLPASADVIIQQETDLIELNYAALTALMEKQPRLGYVLIREIARIEAGRLRGQNP